MEDKKGFTQFWIPDGFWIDENKTWPMLLWRNFQLKLSFFMLGLATELDAIRTEPIVVLSLSSFILFRYFKNLNLLTYMRVYDLAFGRR